MPRLNRIRFKANDGTALFAQDTHETAHAGVPLLCLSGLTRNSKDFIHIVDFLAENRRVIMPDYRGRGQSQWSSSSMLYNPAIEVSDQIALLDHLGIERVAILGTSRGGLNGMVFGSQYPDRLGGLFFNDVGPHLEKAGLLHLRKGLRRKRPILHSWDDAVADLKSTQQGFETLPDAQWLAFARRVFRDVDGIPAFDFDPKLIDTFPTALQIRTSNDLALWGLFNALPDVPLAVVRAGNSNLFSARTMAKMQARKPDLATGTIPDRGHAAFLDEPEAETALRQWLARVDTAAKT